MPKHYFIPADTVFVEVTFAEGVPAGPDMSGEWIAILGDRAPGILTYAADIWLWEDGSPMAWEDGALIQLEAA